VADDAALERRISAFHRELRERCSTDVEPTGLGTAYLNVAFPERYSSNLVWIERDLDGVEVDALADDADRALAAYELRHRHVEVDDDRNGRRLAVGLLDLGWSVESLIRMALRRPSEPRPSADVLETDFETARDVIESTLRAQPYADSDEVVRQLTEWRGVLERAVGARFFVGLIAGEPVSVCEAYVIDGVAQVEDVNTLEAYRGRGLASAVVLAASCWARERGADVVHLIAAEDDWPKELYARLGFDRLGRFWRFTRAPV
jgi:GNAT superfamily N-acetyltransferase